MSGCRCGFGCGNSGCDRCEFRCRNRCGGCCSGICGRQGEFRPVSFVPVIVIFRVEVTTHLSPRININARREIGHIGEPRTTIQTTKRTQRFFNLKPQLLLLLILRNLRLNPMQLHHLHPILPRLLPVLLRKHIPKLHNLPTLSSPHRTPPILLLALPSRGLRSNMRSRPIQ